MGIVDHLVNPSINCTLAGVPDNLAVRSVEAVELLTVSSY